MKDYKKRHTKWCNTCKIYIDKDIYNDHVHSNLFAKSVVDFTNPKKEKLRYFNIIEKRIENHADCLMSATNMNVFDNLDMIYLVPDSEYNNLCNTNIRSVKSLLLNINYFKHENFRQTYFMKKL